MQRIANRLFIGGTGLTCAILYYRTQTLVGACLADDVERVTRLVHEKPDSIKTADILTGLTPIRAALRKARNELVKLFANIEPGVIDSDIITECVQRRQLPVFNELLKNGLDPNFMIGGECPLLFYMIRYDAVDFVSSLIDHGVNLTLTFDHHLPLIYAAKLKSYECVKLLLKKVDNQLIDSSGENVLHTLALDDFPLDGIDINKQMINQQNHIGVTPFMHGVLSGHIDLVKQMLPRVDKSLVTNELMSPLHLAVLTQNAKMSCLLIEAGFDINAANQFGNTPLMEAILVNDNDLIISQLIRFDRLNINAINKRGKSVAHLLAIKNRRLIFEHLIETRHLDPCLPDGQGRTPLFDALDHRSLDVVEFLVAQKTINVTPDMLPKCIDERDRHVEERLVEIITRRLHHHHHVPMSIIMANSAGLRPNSIRTIKRIYSRSATFD